MLGDLSTPSLRVDGLLVEVAQVVAFERLERVVVGMVSSSLQVRDGRELPTHRVHRACVAQLMRHPCVLVPVLLVDEQTCVARHDRAHVVVRPGATLGTHVARYAPVTAVRCRLCI